MALAGGPVTRTVGTLCPADASHGPVLLIGDIYWCPNQSHDSERIRRVASAAPSFPESGVALAVGLDSPVSIDHPVIEGRGVRRSLVPDGT